MENIGINSIISSYSRLILKKQIWKIFWLHINLLLPKKTFYLLYRFPNLWIFFGIYRIYFNLPKSTIS